MRRATVVAGAALALSLTGCSGSFHGIQDVPRRALLGVLDINGNLTLY